MNVSTCASPDGPETTKMVHTGRPPGPCMNPASQAEAPQHGLHLAKVLIRPYRQDGRDHQGAS
eukprot:3011356-Amphidinium_carterae.1